MKYQEDLGNARPGRETSLSWEGRLFREGTLGKETRLSRETSFGFEGRLYRKSRLDRDNMLKRGIILGWKGSPSRKSRLGREASLGWEGGLCREGLLDITYSYRCIRQFNPTSPPPLPPQP